MQFLWLQKILLYVLALPKPTQSFYWKYELQLVNFDFICDPIFMASK